MKPISMNSQPPHHKGQHGLTLIEVMISITISLILLAGVMQIFTGSRQTYRVQDNMARSQENGRFAINFLSKDLRMAGYTGCSSKATSVTNNVKPPNDTAASFPNGGLTGYEYAALPFALTATESLTAAMVWPGTDVVVIKKASSAGVTLTGNLTPNNANIKVLTVTANGMFADNDILFISDCGNGDIFSATNVSGGGSQITIVHSASGNNTPKLSKVYGEDAEVMKLENHVYYIGTDATNNNAPTLYRKRLVGVAMVTEPLVEGVEDMEILYGEDTDAPAAPDGSANRYLAAGTVGLDMNRVVSVRLNLLLRSAEDNLAGTKQTYTFNGSSVTATDHRLRRVFSTTIKVRNKGL